jgi:hypothetical protein
MVKFSTTVQDPAKQPSPATAAALSDKILLKTNIAAAVGWGEWFGEDYASPTEPPAHPPQYIRRRSRRRQFPKKSADKPRPLIEGHVDAVASRPPSFPLHLSGGWWNRLTRLHPCFQVLPLQLLQFLE